MTRRAYLTREEIDRIVELREQRWPVIAIAAELKCAEGSVTWALLREGCDIHADRPLPPVPTVARIEKRGDHVVRRYTQADDTQLLALEAQGLTANRIATIMGRRANSIIGRLRSLARRAERELAAA